MAPTPGKSYTKLSTSSSASAEADQADHRISTYIPGDIKGVHKEGGFMMQLPKGSLYLILETLILKRVYKSKWNLFGE